MIAVPHAPEVEMALLGGMIAHSESIDGVREILRGGAADIFMPRHRYLYDAICAVYDRDQVVDATRVLQALKDAGSLDQAGGEGYLREVLESGYWPAVEHDARVVRDKSVRRQLVTAGESAIKLACDASLPLDEVLTQAERAVLAIHDGEQLVAPVPIEHLAKQAVEKARERAEKGANYGRILTGIESFDDAMFDHRPGSLICLAADTGAGKTSFALQVAENVARAGHPSMYFSLEMSEIELADRLMLANTGLPKTMWHHAKNLDPQVWEICGKTVADMHGLPMYIVDSPQLSLQEADTIVRRGKSRLHVQVVFLDYLQLMTYENPSDETGSLRQLTAGLKRMARNNKVVVWMLSQLTKRSTQRDDMDREPNRNDLHGSSSIYKDANAVVMLHRPDAVGGRQFDRAWQDSHPEKVGQAWVKIDKQRNGPVRRIEMRWDGPRTRFVEKEQKP